MLKSNIPWDNFCMRKYGGTIKKAIWHIAVTQAVCQKMYMTLDKLDKIMAYTKDKVWFNNKTMKDHI